MAATETKPPPPDSQVFVIRRSPPMNALFDPSPLPAFKEQPLAPSAINPPPPLTAPEPPPPSPSPPSYSTPLEATPPPPSLLITTPPSEPHLTPPTNSPLTPTQDPPPAIPPPTTTIPPPTTTIPPPTTTETPPTSTETPPTNSNVPPKVDPNSPPSVFESKVAPVNPDEQFRSPSPQLVSTPTSGSTVTLPPPVESLGLPKQSPPPPPIASGTSSNSNQMVMVVGLSVAGLLILAVLAVCFLCCKKKKKQTYYYGNERQNKDPFHGTREWNSNRHSPGDHIVGILPQSQGMMMQPPGNYSNDYTSVTSGQHPGHTHSHLGSSQCQFSYEDLAAATSGFTPANLLGQGGFGYVHKGVLPDGKVVAVKSLKSGSGQGEREFQAEVEIISRVHHRHLVSLVGYCITNESRMLVYEFVPNQTMEHHLHGKGQPVMDWSFRVRVAIGSAKGLAYLHEDCHPRIIHRDIKAANILLDENYEAMVADFGLAKLTTETDTHVSTRVMGTFGYLAPEYASSGKLSEKSDVFSFGVMLLELITGRRPVDLTGETMEDSLADWARPLLEQAMEDGNILELVDPRLEGHFSPQEMNSMISCAAASIRHSARRRPKMSQIVRALEGNSILVEETSQVPKKTGSIASGTSSHDTTYDTRAYNADMMKFRNMVMSSQDFGASSEFGDTSEYGINPSITSSSSNNSKEMGALNSGQHKIKY